MRSDRAPGSSAADGGFRPETYFTDPGAPPPARLPDAVRTIIARIHPSLMGGLYLPDLLPGEVEIVRIVLASVTHDTISVRARPSGRRIAYRIVDEYEDDNEYPCQPATSSRPLTLARLFRLMERATPYGPIGLDSVQLNLEGGASIDEMRDFVSVTSPFYPQIGEKWKQLIDDWLDEKETEVEADANEEGDDEDAR